MRKAIRYDRKRSLAVVLGAALAILFCIELAYRSGGLADIEAQWSDLWFRLSGKRTETAHVVLVELDEATLAAYPDDPLVFWSPHFARAIGVLRSAGVQAIGLDLLFSVSPEHWLARISGETSPAARTYDRAFRQELAAGGVILAATQYGPDALLPAADYLAVLPDFDVLGHVGATDLTADSDGTVRQAAARGPGAAASPADGLKLISFPLLLAIHASGQPTEAGAWRFGERRIRRDEPAWDIPFAGSPGSVPRISMRDLLADDAGDNPGVRALRGKVVIIGMSYGGANDVHVTPFGHGFFGTHLMSGPEIHAQTVDALLRGNFFAELPAGLRLAIFGSVLVLGAWFWMRLPIGSGALVLVLLLAALALAAYALHRAWWQFPLAHAQFAAGLFWLGIYGLRFSSGERERGQVRALFSRYVSADVMTQLLEAGEMPALGGQSREISVLFSDIRGFTTLSERMTPEEVVEMLNQWFSRACAILLEEGASIDKFIGDAVMAEFGAPLPQPDHARRAIRAALRLSRASAELENWMQERFSGRGLPAFGIGVGIHTGPAVIGNIGSNERMEYTAIGDTVNLASRLEGLTRTLGCSVVASRETVAKAGRGLVTGRSEVLAVKGRTEPVAVFEIHALENENA